jgi:hypothetical protein
MRLCGYQNRSGQYFPSENNHPCLFWELTSAVQPTQLVSHVIDLYTRIPLSIKLFLCLSTVRRRRPYMRIEATLLILNRDATIWIWLASSTLRLFYLLGNRRGYADNRASLGVWRRKENPCSCRESNSLSSVATALSENPISRIHSRKLWALSFCCWLL